jgi:peptidoglycan hydrolase-like protein with peptidoglycan-binding domain
VLRHLKVLSVAVLVVALATGGAAIAIASPWSSSTVVGAQPTSSTSTTVAVLAPDAVSAPTTAAPDAPDPAVAQAQQKLSDLGYWVGTVDGKTGQTTQQAFYAFQKLQGLPRSGTLDAATSAALATATRPQPAAASGDVIEVDKAHQVIFVVHGGQTLWVFNTSTGTEKNYVTNGIKGFAHTPTGTFKVLRVVNGVDNGPLGALYRPRYFTNTGIAIHGAAAIPAYPASHGCSRVSNAAMDFIWANNLMPMGSYVWVYDNPSAQPFTPAVVTVPAPTTTVPVAPTTTAAAVTTTTAPETTSTTAATSTTN